MRHNRFQSLLIGSFCLLSALLVSTVRAEEDPHLFFLGITGAAVEGKAPVLLRWFTLQGTIPVDTYSIYRKPGDAASTQPAVLLSVTSKIRNEPLIRSIFEQPTQRRARLHIQELLAYMLDQPVSDETYVKQLIAVLDENVNCNDCDFRRNMLVNANYGVAVVEGKGYIDAVAPGVYTYELRSSKGTGGTDDLVLGRVTIDAAVPTKLPPPQKPEVVDVPGEKADRRIFLYWDKTAPLQDTRMSFFAYNVYRGEGDASGSDFYTLFNAGQLKKVNRLPILPPAKQALGTKPEDRYVFVDDNLAYTPAGPSGVPLNPGDVYTYWVVPIDLLGQEGEPSPPTAGTVPDKSTPQIPHGLATQVLDDGGVKRIALGWERNTDDTVGYKVYRFRQWDHVGKKDPFPPVDSLTEGYLQDVAQPAADPPLFTDSTVDGTKFENQAFWYCVSAFDGWGNESPLSPPYRGIVFDTQPPSAPATVQVCTTSMDCQFVLKGLEPKPGTDPAVAKRVSVEFIVEHPEPVEGTLRLHILRFASCADPELIPPATKLIFDDIVSGTDALTVTDNFPRPDHGVTISYFVTVFVDGRQVCQTYILPETNFRPAFDEYLVNGYSVSMLARLYVRTIYDCKPMAMGDVPHNPYDDYGNIRPVVFDVAQAEDAAGAVLYRSPDCVNYYPVDEVRFASAAYVKAKDYFAPEQGGRFCYGIRFFDENHNLSPIQYIPNLFLFPGFASTAVVPSMIRAEPLGDQASPGLFLSWFGSNIGVAGFRVEIADNETFTGTVRTVQRNPSGYTFIDKDSEFNTSLDEIDDKTKEKIQIDKTYYIRVVSRLQNGQERISNNHLKFIWTADKTVKEHPNWPIRPLPPVTPTLAAEWKQDTNNRSPFASGTVIDIGYIGLTPATDTYGIIFYVEPPFIVYRRRLDLPNKTFVQISPLIDRVELEDNEAPYDPFLNADYNREIPVIQYLDTVDLIEGARYEYRMVSLNRATGEIQRVYGPSNPVEVTYEVQNP